MHSLFLAMALAAAPEDDAGAAEPVADEAEPVADEAEPVADEAEPVHDVWLTDGQVLRGQLLATSGEGVRLRLGDGRELFLPAEVVARTDSVVVGEGAVGTWGVDPNRTRTLYGPTGFMLGQGNGYVAQRAIAITSAAIGATDWLDVEVGTVLPTLFTETPLGVVGLKVGGDVGRNVRLGLGAQGFLVADVVAGFAFANLTLGTPDSHGTVAVGGAIDATGAEFGALVTTFSYTRRLGPSTALLTENWLLWFTNGDGPWGGPFFVVPSGGVRLFGPAFAVDLALVPIVTGESDMPLLPIPWISFSYNFSLRKGR
jgi:hypothetical protein